MYCSWSGTLVFSPSTLADRFSLMLPETGLVSIRLSVEGKFYSMVVHRYRGKVNDTHAENFYNFSP